MATKALKTITGNKKLVMLAAYHNPLLERTGGGRIWGRAMTQTSCLGIRCNIWARAMRRREITHHL